MSLPFFRAVLFAALVSLLSTLCACTGELTEIVVVVDSDLNVPGEIDRVIIEVEGLGNQLPVDTDLTDGATLPLSLGLVNEGDRLGPINVRVTARRGSSSTPVLMASRNGVLFKKGKTMMLRVDLLRECLSDPSACVRSCADGACLTEWRGLPNKIDESDGGRDAGHDGGDDDAGGDDAGTLDGGDDAGPDASDAMIDSGPIDPCTGGGVTCFNYTPANFEPDTFTTLTGNVAVSIDCLTAEFDSTTLAFNGWCGPEPVAMELNAADPMAPVVIPVASLTITSGGVLRVVGNRPVIFAIYGNATVSGVLDASAVGNVPGAGGNLACTVGTGPAGVDRTQNDRGGNGGGGGGFGSVGGTAGHGDISVIGATPVTTVGGMQEGDAALVPLRGGCAGGRGGRGNATSVGALTGAGGGAVQISVAGMLTVTGVIAAGGGGGGKAPSLEDGGGGGGSGGAILLEAERVVLGPTASFNANGGGGGGGFDYNADSDTSQPGGDAPRLMPVGGAGGPGDNRGGDGGAGASQGVAASAGADGEGGTPIFDANFGAGGGGGGGGLGRIRVRDNTLSASACALTSGTFSPLPSVSCGG